MVRRDAEQSFQRSCEGHVGGADRGVSILPNDVNHATLGILAIWQAKIAVTLDER